MKRLLATIYDAITAPIYRRLSRDVTLHMQELKRSQVEFQDRFTARVCDELIAATLKQPVPADFKDLTIYSDQQIIDIVSQIQNSEDLVSLSKSCQVPLMHLALIYSRYGGMTPLAVRRLRQSENVGFSVNPSASDAVSEIR